MFGEGRGVPEDVAREEEAKLQISRLFREMELQPGTRQKELEGQYTTALPLLSERDESGKLSLEAQNALTAYNLLLENQTDQYDDPSERMVAQVEMAVSLARIKYAGGLQESARNTIRDAYGLAENIGYAELSKLAELYGLLGGSPEDLEEEYY